MIIENDQNKVETPGLRQVVQFIARNRAWVIGTPLLMLALTLVFVTVITPTYEGLTSIRIDKNRSQIPMLDALQDLSSGSEIHTDMAELKSRTLAEDVVAGQNLHVRVDMPRRIPRDVLFESISAPRTVRPAAHELIRLSASEFEIANSDKRVRIGDPFTIDGITFTLAPGAAAQERVRFTVDPFQIAVKDLDNTLRVVRPDREAGIVEVRYETTDRHLARDVPNEVANRFIARRRMNQTSQARSTVAFLQEQIDTLAQQLRLFESGLQQFREGESVVSIEAEGEAQVKRLADFQANRDLIDAERRALEQLLNEVSRESATGGASPFRRLIGFPTLLSNPVATELLGSLNKLENDRSEWLILRTPNDPEVVTLSDRIHDVENQIATLTATYLQGLRNRVASLDETLAGFGEDLKRIPAKEIQLARLKRQARVSEDLYVTLQQRMKEAEIMAAAQDPSVRVIDPAILPLKPLKPDVPLDIVLALLLGVVLGALAAYIREHLDTTIHTREELQIESGMVPVLGMIPRIEVQTVNGNGAHRLWRRATRQVDSSAERRARLVAGHDPRAGAAEAFRSLRTNIVFSRPEKAPKTIVFTSSLPGDGKSTNAANLVITLAQQNLRCIMVDADMRRGAMHHAFDATAKPGLSDYLLGGLSLEDVIRPINLNGTAFDFIPTGTLPPNPAELIASARMQALLEHLDGQYDAVIFDAPPLNVVTDAALLGSKADGVILVVRAGMTDRGGLRAAFAQLNAVHAKIIGCLLNDVHTRRERLYGEYVTGAY
ncbi:MAG: polysaccharide biosynthesis tyrosine autokinase [Gemmatimonadota bacterium]